MDSGRAAGRRRTEPQNRTTTPPRPAGPLPYIPFQPTPKSSVTIGNLVESCKTGYQEPFAVYPDWVVWGSDGGVVVSWSVGEMSYDVHLLDDGRLECLVYSGYTLVSRFDL